MRRQTGCRGFFVLTTAVLLLAGGGPALCGWAAEPELAAKDVEFFERKIRPVLVEHCYRCHSAAAFEKKQLRGGLFVDSREGLLTGGDSGTALEAGKPDDSLLIQSLKYEAYEMPPAGKLPDSVIADFETWIKNGAADPRVSKTELPREQGIDIATGRKHWAYQPLPAVKTTLAKVQRDLQGARVDAGEMLPIDQFLARKQHATGVTALPPADKVTLIRRLTFDLIGLPPTPAEIDSFVNDDSPQSYENLVDRLLASPHFGERWGRHWLDVVRYAESVTLRGLVQQEAWRYRDYVVQAYNDDVPFDQFLQQQIAGDLLPAETVEQKRRNHIATTFLTMTDANLEDQDKLKLEMDVIDEQLDVIGKALLGQTIACARCHDHKFDPIPTADYYALAGILRSTNTLAHSNVSRWIERPLPLSGEEQTLQKQQLQQIASLQKEIASLKKLLPGGARAANSKSRRVINIKELPGIVLDDENAKFTGQWMASSSTQPYVGRGYHHDSNNGQGTKAVTFSTKLPASGRYEIRVSWSPGTNRSTRVPVTVQHADGEKTIVISQRKAAPINGVFASLGEFAFQADTPARVTISNKNADGHVIVDAVQFLPVAKANPADIAKTDPPNKPAKTNVAAVKKRKQQAAEEQQRRKKLTALEAELKTLQAAQKQWPQYMAAEEADKIADLEINIRGDVHNLGPLVPRGFLQVVNIESPQLPEQESGRRELGAWLADPRNPLPSRVYANRVWLWLFGTGIVPTPDNFGIAGTPPTHPELLDYLAGRLIENGWSSKALIREIVLSAAYQRSSDLQAEQLAVDPANAFYWRMNRKRLDAECLTDALLCVSGELDRTVGGKTLPDRLSADYDFHYDGRRRLLYWPVLRNALPEPLLAFDGANPSLVTGRRNSSTVAPQALFLLNNKWVIARTQAAAKRLLTDDTHTTAADRIETAFRSILGRVPTAAELSLARNFLQPDTTASDPNTDTTRWAQLVQALVATLDFRYLH